MNADALLDLVDTWESAPAVNPRRQVVASPFRARTGRSRLWRPPRREAKQHSGPHRRRVRASERRTKGETMYRNRFLRWAFAAIICPFVMSSPAAAESYAVIFAGGGDPSDNHPRYLTSVKRFYWALTMDLGFSTHKVYILSADGTNPANDQSDGSNSDYAFATMSPSVEQATPANLRNRLATLAGQLDESDTFVLWTYDHGGGTEGAPATTGEESLTGWGADINDNQLASWLAPINAGRQAYFFGQCFSGGMLDDLNITGGDGRFGCAAATHYEVSVWNPVAIGPDHYIDAIQAAIRDEDLTTTHDIETWAYDHTHNAIGRGPCCAWEAGKQHPWRVGDNFDLAEAWWTGEGSTDNWSDSSNWFLTGRGAVLPDAEVPGHSRTVRILRPTPATEVCIVDGGTHSLYSLHIADHALTRVTDGANVETSHLELDGNGTLRVADGRTVVAFHTRNNYPDASIEVFNDGEFWSSHVTDYSGSMTIAGGSAEVGYYDGTGTVDVHSGGTLTVSHDMTLGEGSELALAQPGTMVDIGFDARLDGSVSLADDAVLNVDNDAYFNGALSVDSAAELNVGHDLYLGHDAPVTAEIELATANVGYSLFHEEGELTVTRSTLNAPYIHIDGDIASRPTLTLRGSTLTANRVWVGDSLGGAGSMTLNSAGAVDPEIRTTSTSDPIEVGRNGLGEITQNAGTVSCVAGSTDYPDAVLGRFREGYGIYNLNGGTLEVNDLTVSWNGTGIFTQTDGTCRVHHELTIGREFLPGDFGTGIYNLNGGILETDELIVGWEGTGSFTQRDGTCRVLQELMIGGDYGGEGTCTLSGGVFEVPAIRQGDPSVLNSTLNINGGVLTVTGGSAGPVDIDVDTLILASVAGTEGDFDLGDKALGCGKLSVGQYGRGDFDFGPGATIIADVEMVVGECTDGDGDVGQTGGHLGTPELKIGLASSSSGTYSLEGGSVRADSISVAVDGHGQFDQLNDSEVQTDALTVGVRNSSTTNYYLQTGGTTTVNGRLKLGVDTGGNGKYYFGWIDPTVSLTTQWVEVGIGGDGEFSHRCGTHDVSEGVILGSSLGGEGAYSLEAGELNTPQTTVVQGVFEHSDGTHQIANSLCLGANGETGTYEMTGGNLNVPIAEVGLDGSGTFTQNGGTHHVSDQLYLGASDEGSGAYTLSGGLLLADDNVYLAYATGSTATFDQSGGSSATVGGDLYIGYAAGTTATYSFDGNTSVAPTRLTVNGTLYVGSGDNPGTLDMIQAYGEIDGTGSLVVGTRGTLRSMGTIRLPIVNHNEIIAPGATTTLRGAYSGSGSFEVTDFANLCIYGSATFDGPLTGGGGVAAFSETTFNSTVDARDVQISAPTTVNDDVNIDQLTLNDQLLGPGPVTANITTIQGTITQTHGMSRSLGEVGILSASYDIEGGELNTATVYNYGVMAQSGGIHEAERLVVGGRDFASMWGVYADTGSYTISDGALSVGTLELGYDELGLTAPGMLPPPEGELNISNLAANVTVSEKLVLGQSARITAVDGAQIFMTGSAVENYSETPENLADLGNVELIFIGGATEIDLFEVAGEDRSNLPAGLRNNCALGRLSLGGFDVGRVQLVDLFDNQPDWTGAEALYVRHLEICAGSILDLNDFSLYYLTSLISPSATIVGEATAIHEPTTSVAVEGLPAGSEVEVTLDPGGSGGMGTMGIAGEYSHLLSFTAELDATDVENAIAALAEEMEDPYITLIISYDEEELAILGIDEDSLKPHWWDETAGDGGEWVLCGTTTAGEVGEGYWVGANTLPADYEIGHCGVYPDGDYIWANINHASEYAASGVIPEPSTVILLATGAFGLLAYGWRRRHR